MEGRAMAYTFQDGSVAAIDPGFSQKSDQSARTVRKMP
jgi:hypothetical protein